MAKTYADRDVGHTDGQWWQIFLFIRHFFSNDDMTLLFLSSLCESDSDKTKMIEQDRTLRLSSHDKYFGQN